MTAVRAWDAFAPRGRPEACSALAERLGEDVVATAPTAARRFLLLEHPGPWPGSEAVGHRDLGARAAEELLARAGNAGMTVLWIRRGSQRDVRDGRRTCFLAAVDELRLERFELGTARDVLELDLAAFASTAAPADAWDQPVYAVCTHGRRDLCCARLGHPLFKALRAERPDQTWEITHVGGHRFAPTLVMFPHGLVLGRVPATAGLEIVTVYEAGEIALEYLRGRAGDPWPVQAADVLVRRALGVRAIDGLVVEQVDVDGDRVEATLRVAGRGRLVATVARHVDERRRPLSCGAEPQKSVADELVSRSWRAGA